MDFRRRYQGSKGSLAHIVEDGLWGNLAPRGDLEESASHHMALTQYLTLIHKLCFLSGASRSDVMIRSTSRLKVLVATHSFGPQGGCCTHWRIIILRAETSERKQWVLCELLCMDKYSDSSDVDALSQRDRGRAWNPHQVV